MPAPPSGNLLDVFEARELPYLARLRQNPRLLRLRGQIHMPMVVLSADEALIRFEEFEYQANSWRRPQRVVYVHINEPGDVVERGFLIITSMAPRQISPLDLYRRRACAEDAARKTLRGRRCAEDPLGQ